ncbi:hypothetical protein GFC29_1805 [Anoxybacillus sp. B7M1]|jgi:hypothetical protein|nr:MULTISPECIES: hypothetical protein [unclassified Anoxybacillus]ANB56446.1 hypothetical protein GFC28_3628 [Anoxybacillus sp. B2M1]ANB63352.1 hypothetical protein GFC29_1805 [Anoxybacillus sp. B7M1]
MIQLYGFGVDVQTYAGSRMLFRRSIVVHIAKSSGSFWFYDSRLK